MAAKTGAEVARLPHTVKFLLENIARRAGGRDVSEADVVAGPELCGKTAEVVNRPGCRTDCHPGARYLPVRRDRKDRFWPCHFATNAPPPLGPSVPAECVHRVTMAEETAGMNSMIGLNTRCDVYARSARVFPSRVRDRQARRVS